MEKKKFILTDDYKQNAFSVPEGYFEAMQDRLTDRIAAETRPQPGRWRALRPQLAFAAGFVALIVAAYGSLHLFNESKRISTDMTADDLYIYATNVLNVDEHTVLSLMDEETQDSSVDTDIIINYLADARIGITDIASLY